MKSKDLTGGRFGYLVVESRDLTRGCKPLRWLCKCDCGNTSVVHGSSLRTGNTRSCGCLYRRAIGDRARTHGLSQSSFYSVWNGMMARCYNPQSPNYSYYGGRGISVCEMWRKSILNFIEDMGPRPEGTTLDRIDNNGNYGPGNCRWATRGEQSVNKRTSRVITAFGKTQCLREWAEEKGIHKGTLQARLRRGMPIEIALTAPAMDLKQKGRKRTWLTK